jgi:Asp-tRNA(Asn)/Glu-tRNA(Gln) amidotransferase B subunit
MPVAAIVSENPGRPRSTARQDPDLGWSVGQVMKKTGGRADPAAVREALTKALTA